MSKLSKAPVPEKVALEMIAPEMVAPEIVPPVIVGEVRVPESVMLVTSTERLSASEFDCLVTTGRVSASRISSRRMVVFTVGPT